jgi:Cu+-exporting ATPase
MNDSKGQPVREADDPETFNTVPEGYTGTVYTCPMHPEIRDTEEGKCPKCGMFLVPEGEAADHAHHGHDHSGHSHAHGAATAGVKEGEYDTVPEGYAGTVYTCPMHAEVRHPGPGSCPICGMGWSPRPSAQRTKALTPNWSISPGGSGSVPF